MTFPSILHLVCIVLNKLHIHRSCIVLTAYFGLDTITLPCLPLYQLRILQFAIGHVLMPIFCLFSL